MDTVRYVYKPKLWTYMLVGLFFAGCGVVMAKAALDNDRGLILNGIIRLDMDDATTFYWGIAGLSIAFVAAALIMIVASFGAPQEVVIDRNAITAPSSILRKTIVTIPFSSVRDLEIREINSQKFLMIHHSDGTLAINRAMLPTQADFDHMVDAISTRSVMTRRR